MHYSAVDDTVAARSLAAFARLMLKSTRFMRTRRPCHGHDEHGVQDAVPVHEVGAAAAVAGLGSVGDGVTSQAARGDN